MLDFTYDSYIKLLTLIKQHGYVFSDYKNFNSHNKCIIMRHDVDFSVKRALEIAKIESDNNVSSTFFIMLTSDFYNAFSPSNRKCIFSILERGHQIGVHFDPNVYDNRGDLLVRDLLKEIRTFEMYYGISTNSISFHRPPKEMVGKNLIIPGMVNAYGEEIFSKVKYVSDSRRYWREPIELYLEEERYPKIHILTHPFWYEKYDRGSIEASLKVFINEAQSERKQGLENNIAGFRLLNI